MFCQGFVLCYRGCDVDAISAEGTKLNVFSKVGTLHLSEQMVPIACEEAGLFLDIVGVRVSKGSGQAFSAIARSAEGLLATIEVVLKDTVKSRSLTLCLRVEGSR